MKLKKIKNFFEKKSFEVKENQTKDKLGWHSDEFIFFE
jgi:hypothetical protein